MTTRNVEKYNGPGLRLSLVLSYPLYFSKKRAKILGIPKSWKDQSMRANYSSQSYLDLGLIPRTRALVFKKVPSQAFVLGMVVVETHTSGVKLLR